jgi:catechol 2,3-dioxygenase-like lactoylglutathione lyase family enzyme
MSSDWEVRAIFHFTVNASDLERSLEFYQRLGFRLLRDNRDVVWPPFVATNFGMKRAQGVVFHGAPNPPDPRSGIEAVVCCRDPDGNIVELIEYMEGVLGSRVEHLERRKVEAK